MRNKYVKTRVSLEEFQKALVNADSMGLTLSEFVRLCMSREAERVSIEAAIDEVKGMFEKNPSHNQDPLLVEVALILRELVSENNAQILSRVSRQLDQRFGEGRIRV